MALVRSVLLLKSFIRCQIYCLIGHTTHSVFLPGKSHGQKSPVGYGPQGRRDSDTTGPELDEEDPDECQLESTQLRAGFPAPITPFSDEHWGEGRAGLCCDSAPIAAVRLSSPRNTFLLGGKEMTTETTRLLLVLSSLLPVTPLPVCTL